jgi:mRNA interferase HicA
MKRTRLVKHLTGKNCELLREGAKHSWWWNPKTGKRSAVPRHTELSDLLAKKICDDLGIEKP